MKMYGFLYRRYKRRYFFWESVLQVEALALVLVDVFARTIHEYQQALLLLAVLTLIAIANMATQPLKAPMLTLMEFVSLGVLSLTITLGLFFVGGFTFRSDNKVCT
ncbi:hypothetical protein HXX76_008076 [Chlamydomonas incerta]|uniref:Uncharacterized protein n=1 Tax=Chlamydomonas incerta TaxID=51695 RepID=A0A835W1F8_CHLIN|nr:hypothetical protein HXX76_008076 [Chlamydomonas incerta]|eukprot:KAG2433708.1 hypothetical protein HXX76_008076 [Chlamydomonas incerta]